MQLFLIHSFDFLIPPTGMDISTAFTVSTYAMAEGRENSEIVTATFGLPKIAGDLNEDGHIDISDVTTLVNIILGK